MPIGKKPQRNTSDSITDISAAELAFINGAAPEPPGAPTGEDNKRKPVLIRFDPDLLKRVDKAAKRMGVSHSAWLYYAASQVLEDE